MRLFKRGLAGVMAAEAKGDLGLYEEVFLVGTVGEMAGRAAFSLTYLMDYFLFIILLFMTLITSLVPFRFQQVTCLRGMRVVALNTFSILQYRMHIRFVHPDLFFAVAGVADLVADGMHIFHRQIFLCEFLVAIEAFFARKPGLPPGCPRASQRPFLRSLRTGVQQDPTE
jgi:hypothetical protein